MGAKQQGADATAGRWLTIPRTLCFVVNGEDVLMMKRAAHKRIFPNGYNGVGGHIERGEDPLSGARREILEETGLEVQNLRLRAVYHIDAGAEIGILNFVFTATCDRRDLPDVMDEGTLHWIPRHLILDLDLVEDLPLILPRILDMADTDVPLFVHISYDDRDQIRLCFAGEQ